MKLTKKRKTVIGIILTSVIILALFTIYTLKSGSEKFAILNIDKLNNLNDPALKTAIKATEECNKLEINYINYCYRKIAWELGYYTEHPICEKLKEKLKPDCYKGCGRKIGERYSPDIEKIKNECSKFLFYEECLHEAALIIGRNSSDSIETEQCKEFEQEIVKRMCYEGLGQQLARDNKGSSLCEKVEGKRTCLTGYAYGLYKKGDRDGALQMCNDFLTEGDEERAKRCYSQIGLFMVYFDNLSIEESFRNCEKYIYPEDCKQRAVEGMTKEFFENEDSST